MFKLMQQYVPNDNEYGLKGNRNISSQEQLEVLESERVRKQNEKMQMFNEKLQKQNWGINSSSRRSLSSMNGSSVKTSINGSPLKSNNINNMLSSGSRSQKFYIKQNLQKQQQANFEKLPINKPKKCEIKIRKLSNASTQNQWGSNSSLMFSSMPYKKGNSNQNNNNNNNSYNVVVVDSQQQQQNANEQDQDQQTKKPSFLKNFLQSRKKSMLQQSSEFLKKANIQQMLLQILKDEAQDSEDLDPKESEKLVSKKKQGDEKGTQGAKKKRNPNDSDYDCEEVSSEEDFDENECIKRGYTKFYKTKQPHQKHLLQQKNELSRRYIAPAANNPHNQSTQLNSSNNNNNKSSKNNNNNSDNILDSLYSFHINAAQNGLADEEFVHDQMYKDDNTCKVRMSQQQAEQSQTHLDLLLQVKERHVQKLQSHHSHNQGLSSNEGSHQRLHSNFSSMVFREQQLEHIMSNNHNNNAIGSLSNFNNFGPNSSIDLNNHNLLQRHCSSVHSNNNNDNNNDSKNYFSSQQQLHNNNNSNIGSLAHLPQLSKTSFCQMAASQPNLRIPGSQQLQHRSSNNNLTINNIMRRDSSVKRTVGADSILANHNKGTNALHYMMERKEEQFMEKMQKIIQSKQKMGSSYQRAQPFDESKVKEKLKKQVEHNRESQSQMQQLVKEKLNVVKLMDKLEDFQSQKQQVINFNNQPVVQHQVCENLSVLVGNQELMDQIINSSLGLIYEKKEKSKLKDGFLKMNREQIQSFYNDFNTILSVLIKEKLKVYKDFRSFLEQFQTTEKQIMDIIQNPQYREFTDCLNTQTFFELKSCFNTTLDKMSRVPFHQLTPELKNQVLEIIESTRLLFVENIFIYKQLKGHYKLKQKLNHSLAESGAFEKEVVGDIVELFITYLYGRLSSRECLNWLKTFKVNINKLHIIEGFQLATLQSEFLKLQGDNIPVSVEQMVKYQFYRIDCLVGRDTEIHEMFDNMRYYLICQNKTVESICANKKTLQGYGQEDLNRLDMALYLVGTFFSNYDTFGVADITPCIEQFIELQNFHKVGKLLDLQINKLFVETLIQYYQIPKGNAKKHMGDLWKIITSQYILK